MEEKFFLLGIIIAVLAGAIMIIKDTGEATGAGPGCLILIAIGIFLAICL